MSKGVAVKPAMESPGNGATQDEDRTPEPTSVTAAGTAAPRLLQDIRRMGWVAAGPDGPGPIDRRSPVPLYVQIRRRLLSLIAGWPDPTKRFYTDEELCQRFGVARMTVRAAIKEFVDEGLLTRVRGAGTYVAFEKVDEHFTPRMDFIDQWATRGRPLSLDIRRLEMVEAPPPFATALGIETGAPVLYVERLRATGPVPVSIDYRFVLADAGQHITAEAARERSLLELLAQAADLDHADMTIEAGVAEDATAETLELMPGDPVLVRGLVYADTAGRRVMAGVSFYRPDQTAYSIRVPLGGLAAAAAKRNPLDTGEDGPEWGHLVHMRQEIRGS